MTGYSSSSWIPAALMASEKRNIWVKKLMEYYENRHFIQEDGRFDLKANNIIITEMSKKQWGFKAGDSWLEFGKVRLYPREYFQPYAKRVIDWKSTQINDLSEFHRFFNIDKELTYCIHYDTVSWRDDTDSCLSLMKHALRIILPQKVFEMLHQLYYKRRDW